MQSVTRNDLTDYNRIVIDWVHLPAPTNGDSPTLGYNVQYRQVSASQWVDLVLPEADFVLLATTAVDGLIRGEAYEFRIRARNVYGFGDFSTATTILASDKPSAPQQAWTETVGTNVIVRFTKPSDNGDPISSYEVEFENNNQIFEQASECTASL